MIDAIKIPAGQHGLEFAQHEPLFNAIDTREARAISGDLVAAGLMNGVRAITGGSGGSTRQKKMAQSLGRAGFLANPTLFEIVQPAQRDEVVIATSEWCGDCRRYCDDDCDRKG